MLPIKYPILELRNKFHLFLLSKSELLKSTVCWPIAFVNVKRIFAFDSNNILGAKPTAKKKFLLDLNGAKFRWMGASIQ